jgi:hypothetical protein
VTDGGLVVGIGHLGWSQHRAGTELYAGNDPTVPRADRRLLFDESNFHEGQTILVIAFPGRFTSDREVGLVAQAVVAAATGVKRP